ncbi:MAG: radical SAM protein [Candidatus Altiarchaeota archaeon]
MPEESGGRGRVLLVSPPYDTLFNIDRSQYMPLGLLYLASVLKDGYDVRVYNADLHSGFFKSPEKHASELDYDEYGRSLRDDMHHSWVKMRRVIEEYKPDYVGVELLTMTYTSGRRVAEIAKGIKDSTVLIGGGVDATLRPGEILADGGFDYVVRGEGEVTLRELLDTLSSGGDVHSVKGVSFTEGGSIVENQDRGLIDDLDLIPFPDRESLVEFGRYEADSLGRMITGRGCPFNCSFCASRVVWSGSHRLRSPENVVDEIEMVYYRYGTRQINFLDDTFNVDEKRVMRMCDLIEARDLRIIWNCLVRSENVNKDVIGRMQDVGLVNVAIGVESGSQRMLDRMNKKADVEGVRKAVETLKGLGVYVRACFMMGYPGETRETLEQTEKLVSDMDVEYNIEVFKPYHGTPAYETLEKQGRIITQSIDDYYRYYSRTFTDDGISWDYLVDRHRELVKASHEQRKRKTEEFVGNTP